MLGGGVCDADGKQLAKRLGMREEMGEDGRILLMCILRQRPCFSSTQLVRPLDADARLAWDGRMAQVPLALRPWLPGRTAGLGAPRRRRGLRGGADAGGNRGGRARGAPLWGAGRASVEALGGADGGASKGPAGSCGEHEDEPVPTIRWILRFLDVLGRDGLGPGAGRLGIPGGSCPRLCSVAPCAWLGAEPGLVPEEGDEMGWAGEAAKCQDFQEAEGRWVRAQVGPRSCSASYLTLVPLKVLLKHLRQTIFAFGSSLHR